MGKCEKQFSLFTTFFERLNRGSLQELQMFYGTGADIDRERVVPGLDIINKVLEKSLRFGVRLRSAHINEFSLGDEAIDACFEEARH